MKDKNIFPFIMEVDYSIEDFLNTASVEVVEKPYTDITKVVIVLPAFAMAFLNMPEKDVKGSSLVKIKDIGNRTEISFGEDTDLRILDNFKLKYEAIIK